MHEYKLLLLSAKIHNNSNTIYNYQFIKYKKNESSKRVSCKTKIFLLKNNLKYVS